MSSREDASASSRAASGRGLALRTTCRVQLPEDLLKHAISSPALTKADNAHYSALRLLVQRGLPPNALFKNYMCNFKLQRALGE